MDQNFLGSIFWDIKKKTKILSTPSFFNLLQIFRKCSFYITKKHYVGILIFLKNKKSLFVQKKVFYSKFFKIPHKFFLFL